MSDPVETFPLTWARALWAAIGRMNRNNGFVMASHVAMSVMLAVFPFILFVVALAGAMTGVVVGTDGSRFPFCSACSPVRLKSLVETDDLQAAMHIFDQDKDGFISPKEMISALSKFGITINDKEVKQLIGEATLGGEKRVNFETFKKVITQAVH